MAYSPTSPVTGAAQTGLTSPTYTLTADKAPDLNSTQHAVTALGGTQTGVVAHSVSSPFTLTFWRPRIFKLLGVQNPVTGAYGKVELNVYRLMTRKGVLRAANQPPVIMYIETHISVPAGADSTDTLGLRAALSAHIGMLTQQSAGIGDTAQSGVV